MSTNPIPANLDWVTARSRCTLYQLFKRLEAGVMQDLQIRATSLPERTVTTFNIVGATQRSFSVLREDRVMPVPREESVDFHFEDDHISIADRSGLDIK